MAFRNLESANIYIVHENFNREFANIDFKLKLVSYVLGTKPKLSVLPNLI